MQDGEDHHKFKVGRRQSTATRNYFRTPSPALLKSDNCQDSKVRATFTEYQKVESDYKRPRNSADRRMGPEIPVQNNAESTANERGGISGLARNDEKFGGANPKLARRKIDRANRIGTSKNNFAPVPSGSTEQNKMGVGFKAPKQTFGRTQIQVRRHKHSTKLFAARRLLRDAGLKRGIFPLQNESQTQTISSIQGTRQNFPIQCDGVWNLERSFRLHAINETDNSSITSTRDSVFNLSGRSDNRGTLSKRGAATFRNCGPSLSTIGIRNQLGKESDGSNKTFNLSRHDDRHGTESFHNFSAAKETSGTEKRSASGGNETLPRHSDGSSSSKIDGQINGVDDCGPSGPISPSFAESLGKLRAPSVVRLGKRKRLFRQLRRASVAVTHGVTRLPVASTLLAADNKDTHTDSTTKSRRDVNHRRIAYRFRSNSTNWRSAAQTGTILESKRAADVAKHARADGIGSRFPTFLEKRNQQSQSSADPNRQYYSSVMPTEIRVPTQTLGRSRRSSSESDIITSHCASGAPRSRNFERSSGQIISARSRQQRMGNFSRSGPSRVSPISDPTDTGLVCDKNDDKMQSICIPTLVRQSDTDKRICASLGRRDRILGTTNQFDFAGPGQNLGRRRTRHTRRSTLANSTMVSHSSAESQRDTLPAQSSVHPTKNRAPDARRASTAPNRISALKAVASLGVSNNWQITQDKAVEDFEKFCNTMQIDNSNPSLDDISLFLLQKTYVQDRQLFDADSQTSIQSQIDSFCTLLENTITQDLNRKDQTSKTMSLMKSFRPIRAPATILSLASALKNGLTEQGVQISVPPGALLRERRIKAAIAKLALPGNADQRIPYAPIDLIPFLPAGNTITAIRDRALFSIRATTCMRPSEPGEILRSTIQQSVDNLGRPIVLFKLARTKGASAAGRIMDSNYVEFLDINTPVQHPELSADDICPARLMLKLKRFFDNPKRNVEHDSIFAHASKFTRLKPDSLSKIVTRLLQTADLPQMKAHSLRAAANQYLNNLGVPPSDIEIRGGWSSSFNAVRVDHYTSFRFVPTNFAQAMLDTRVRRQAARSVGLGFLKSNISLGSNNNVQLEQSFVPQHDVPTFRNDEAFQPIRPIRASGSLVNNDQKQSQKFSQWRFQQHLVQLNSDANSSSLSAQSTQSDDGSDDISSSLPLGGEECEKKFSQSPNKNFSSAKDDHIQWLHFKSAQRDRLTDNKRSAGARRRRRGLTRWRRQQISLLPSSTLSDDGSRSMELLSDSHQDVPLVPSMSALVDLRKLAQSALSATLPRKAKKRKDSD